MSKKDTKQIEYWVLGVNTIAMLVMVAVMVMSRTDVTMSRIDKQFDTTVSLIKEVKAESKCRSDKVDAILQSLATANHTLDTKVHYLEGQLVASSRVPEASAQVK